MQQDQKLKDAGSRDGAPRVCLIGVSLDSGNMGVRALAVGSIQCVLAQYPNAEISVFDYAKQSATYTVALKNRQVSVPLVNIRFSKRFYLSNNIAFLIALAAGLKLIPSRRIRERLMARNRCLRHILEADIVASLAGGDSFSDIYGLRRLLYVALPQVLVLLAGKDLILLPQTVGPFKTSLARRIAGYILRRARQVYCRDFPSVAEVGRLTGHRGPAAKAEFRYDVGFAVDPIKPGLSEIDGFPAVANEKGSLVGLNVSGLLFIGGYTENNMFGLRADYRELLKGIVDLLIARKGARVLLVPHVFAGKWEREGDADACESVYAELAGRYPGRLGIIRGSYNQSEIKYLIGQCDFFIGSRMHACIGAISQSVPAVSVAYSEKFAGVMETIGIASLVADACRLNKEEILQVVERAYDDRAVLRAQLEEKMVEVRKSVLTLFSGLPQNSGPEDQSQALAGQITGSDTANGRMAKDMISVSVERKA